MAGPTWPPTPEAAASEVIEEYGDLARRVMGQAETDEEAELALLSHFLFAPPPRQYTALSDGGTPLAEVEAQLRPWLRMLTGMDFRLSVAEPAGTDGEDLYLPSALPGPPSPGDDLAIYQGMALIQLGLVRFGLLRQRRVLVELHSDWVLRSCWMLLAARYVIGCWEAEWPGVATIFERIRASSKATSLRVGHQEVPRDGLPAAFLPLYGGLAGPSGPNTTEGAPAQAAVQAVGQVASPAAAPLIIVGQAQRLREHLRSQRLGPPPLPCFVGLLRPAWMLDDLPAEMAAANEWRQGNKPLRPLLAAMARSGRGRDVAAKLKRRLAGAATEPEWREEPRPLVVGDADGYRYDEWDLAGRHYRVGATRVREATAAAGPLAAYERIVKARAGEIAAVRREFEALRVEQRWHHAQPDGSDLDLSRAVAAMVEVQAGHTPRVDWYQRFEREPRSACVLTLVDLSGSTQGAVIHAEREAMVLFSAALSTLDLPYALAGFSSRGPQECTWQWIQEWDVAADDKTHKRIANLQAGGGTRLGAFIRHATASLVQRPEERRVLLLVSDGRPEDGEAYRGAAGIADCALAVRAARKAGLYCFCVSLDERDGAQEYLSTIFSEGHFLVCGRPEALPTRLPEVFRRWVL